MWSLLSHINGAHILAAVILVGGTYVVWCCLRVGAIAEKRWDAMVAEELAVRKAQAELGDDKGRRGL